MPIPFPPDGPQVQAALQKVPTPQLQQYAAGRPPQPTGQVQPGPMGAAAEALNARGAMGAANQRQQAMQNNPANSPTIFQQKDAELAAMKQQMQQMQQQTQQKEQQLGVLGALMAKKAQDMQARESMGVANLPVRPDMFTAMDGGVVFSGGGAVQRFNGLSSSAVKLGGKTWEELSEVPNEPASSLSELIAKPFTRGGKKIDPITGEPITLGEFLRRAEGAGTKSSAVDTRDDVLEIPARAEPSESKPRKEDRPSGIKTPTLPGVASLGARSTFEGDIERLSHYLARSPEQTQYARRHDESMQKIADLAKAGVLTEEQAKKMMDARKAEMAEQYGRYSKDRDTRQEELIGAMKGEAPTFQERLGAGLKRLPVDLKGVRLGGLFGALGAGAAESDAEYRKREREANIKRAEIRELNAKADLLEERGQMAEADKVRKEAEARKKDEALFGIKAEEAKAAGIASLLQQATEEQRGIKTAATNLLGEETRARNQAAIEKYRVDAQAALQTNKPSELMKSVQELATLMGVSPREAFALIKPAKDTEAFPSAVQAKIYDTVAAKYSNPYSPAVVAAVEAINPEAAKILRLGEKEAKNQRGLGAALAVVEQAMDAELRGRLNKPLNYGVLPAPPSR